MSAELHEEFYQLTAREVYRTASQRASHEDFSQHTGQVIQETKMRASPIGASSPAKVRTIPHDASVDRQPLLNALRRHWPEYVMEGVELGLYMISACAFVVLFQYPTLPVHQVFPDPTLRLVRHCHGRDRHRHHLLPYGSTLGCTL